MQTNCNACSAPITAVVYEVTVQQRVADADGVMQPVGAALDLRLCIRCGCGLNSHALPLAIEHRSQEIDRQRHPKPD